MNKESIVGGGVTISGIFATAAGTAVVQFLTDFGVTLTPEQSAWVTGGVVIAVGIAKKIYKAWKTPKVDVADLQKKGLL